MKTHSNTGILRRLGQAISVGTLVAVSPGMMAQVPAPAQEQATQREAPQQQATPQKSITQDPAIKREPAARTIVTGSNIARIRKEPGPPLVVLDRTYIDQTGATTPREVLETVPQVQIRGR
jgi:outer membrane cobalamin receptor